MVKINIFSSSGHEIMAASKALESIGLEGNFYEGTPTLLNIVNGGQRRANFINSQLASYFHKNGKLADVNICFTDKKLEIECGEEFSATFGYSFEVSYGSNIIISTEAIRTSAYSDERKKAMLIYLILHELGHAFHAADNTSDDRVTADQHCKMVACAMQHPINLAMLADMAKSTEYRNIYLCVHCMNRIRFYNNIRTKYSDDARGMWHSKKSETCSGSYARYLEMIEDVTTPFVAKIEKI